MPGDKNIPFPTVTVHCNELRQYDAIYIYGYGGQGSGTTASKLAEIGFQNFCYVGQEGMNGRQSRGYPVKSQKQQAGR